MYGAEKRVSIDAPPIANSRCWSVAGLSSLMADAGSTIHDHRATGGDRAALIAHKPD